VQEAIRIVGAGLALVVASAATPCVAATPAIAAGGVHSMALGADGQVRTWGDDSAGELGTGRPIDSAVALVVAGLPPIAYLAAGGNHTLAVTSAGTVMAWGGNSSGELGTGSTYFAQPAPIPVEGLSGIVAVTAGPSSSYAVDNQGLVYSWGANDAGQLGDGTKLARLRAQRVPTLPRMSAIAAGASHALGLATDGSVWSWG